MVAHFDRPHTSNGSTGAIGGRPEHLRGTAFDFRNLVHRRIETLRTPFCAEPGTGQESEDVLPIRVQVVRNQPAPWRFAWSATCTLLNAAVNARCRCPAER